MRRARVEIVEDAGDLHAGRADELARGVVGGHDQLAGEQLARRAPACVGQLERVERREVREVAGHRGVDGGQRVRLAADDRAVLQLEPARGRGVQPVGRGFRRVPSEQPAAQPVRGLLPAEERRRAVADHVGGVVIGEGQLSAGRVERDVGAAGRSAGPVVLVPRVVERHLVLERPGRHVERPAEHARRAGDRLQPRLHALRLPVARAAELALQRADQRDHARHGRVMSLRRRRQRQHSHQDDEYRRSHRLGTLHQ